MEKRTLRVAITGGSGFIGTNAVNYCLENNINCINIDIKAPNDKTHVSLWHQIDIRDKQLFFDCLRDYQPTHILHLAATTGMDVKDLSFFDTNIDGVANLIAIGKELPTLSRIVFTSSLLVCKNGYIPKSDTEYCPPNLYGKSKMLGEQLVRQVTHLPFDWTIVRPTSIWGPWFEHSYKAFFQVINKGLYFHPGKKEIIKPASYVGNTVYMMFALLFGANKLVSRQTFYLADYPTYSTRKWANTIQEQMKPNSKLKTMPLSLLKIAAILCDILKKCGYKNLPLSRFRLSNMLIGGAYPTENTQLAVGPLPSNLEQGVSETIMWMQKYRHL